MNGAIAWFARNSVAANVLMALIVAGGLLTAWSVKLEVFPEFSLDLITVSVEYLGAAPEEVEEAVCVRIEEAIQGLDGVKEVRSTAAEGRGVVTVELELGADARAVLDDVKSRVDAIDTFPEETEKPVIREITNQRQVIDVAVWGDAGEATLKHLAEQVRDEISSIPGITQVDLTNARAYEISIEVSENDLRRHGLTFDQVAAAVRRSSVDLPGGQVKTRSGEILLRSGGEAKRGEDFERLVLLTRPDGTRVLLGDVARVVDGFTDTDELTLFNGERSMTVEIYRTGDQSALDIAAKVREYVEENQARMPEGVTLTTWQDASKVLSDRLDLLFRNARSGLLLVFITLALFLRFRLAFWVMIGIPISFLGAIWLMPTLGVSVNVISLFAFIVVLGIVVDDAIIAGENIFTHQQRHRDGLRGSIEGAQEISRPITFAILTTIAAFLPLLLVPGTFGKIFAVIPLIVIPCLVFSLIESLFILPAHISHMRHRPPDARPGPWRRFQGAFASGLDWFVGRVYKPLLRIALNWRYATLALGVGTLILTVGFVIGGRVRFVFFPDVEADYLAAEITMRPGTPADVTAGAVRQVERGLEELRRRTREETGKDMVRLTVSSVGNQPFLDVQRIQSGQPPEGFSSGNLGEVFVELIPSEERTLGSTDLASRWRELAGSIPDADEVSYSASIFSAGSDIDVQLTGPDLDRLRAAAEQLKTRLRDYTGVYGIADSFQEGKKELRLGIRPGAEVLGLTLADLARQVRQAFYGEEAQRIIRGREDIRVMVRYPESERRSLGDLENMRIRTPDGREVPFGEVAIVEEGRGNSSIRRVNRRRVVNVTADVDLAKETPAVVIADLQARVLPEILAAHPGVLYTLEGQQAEQRETLGGLFRGFAIAVIAIFALLAIPLRSYVHPLVIMLAIPFGLVGAIWGHMIMGLDLTILSMFGIVALAGVVVNDSLVMVDFINRHRRTRDELLLAIRDAGAVRFRPILLTSLTTFAGLSPLMFERSMQAQFLIPMAVSLAFGVLFSTFISLVLVPCGYMLVEDLRALLPFGSGDAGESASSGAAAEVPSPAGGVAAAGTG